MLEKLIDAIRKYERFVYLVALLGALIWFTLIWFIWLDAEDFFRLIGVSSFLITSSKYILIIFILIVSYVFLKNYIQLNRVFRPMIEFLELTKGPPLRLISLISLIGGLIWFIWSNAEDFFQRLGIPSILSISLKYGLITLIFVISLIFFALVITLMFSLERRVRVLARSYTEDDELIIFLKSEVKEWLTMILDIVNNLPTKSGKKYTKSQLKKIEYEISNKGRYLEYLVSEVSYYLQVSKESVEELIGIKVGVEQQIAKAIIYNYKKIQEDIETLNIIRPNHEFSDYFENEILEKINDIQTNKQLLNTQIKWIEQLEKQQGNIKDILKIIKEASTGKAIVLLAELLITAKKPEQLKFLIQAVNSRVGYKLSELLGFKLKLKSPYLFSWDEIQENNYRCLKEFLEQNCGIDWVKKAKIESNDDDKAIRISDEKNSFSLRLNDEKIKTNLIINDNRVDEFIVKTENGKQKVYKSYLETELTWYEEPVKNLLLIQEFLKRFDRLRNTSLKKNLLQNFNDYEHIEYSQISIALSFGYSAVLARILQNIIEKARNVGKSDELRIMIIKSEGFKNKTKIEDTLPSGEELLKDELISKFPDIPDLKDRFTIFPIETIKEKNMEGKINKIFIGIESINISGNVVHPKGGTNIIRYLKEKNRNVKVYAFGETYKVQDFDDFHIDYTKLSMLEGNKFIDCIVTDHEVHMRNGGEWDLYCCMKHWIDQFNLDLLGCKTLKGFQIKLKEKIENN